MAFRKLQGRGTKPLVESDFMQCHTIEQVKELAKRPIQLSDELREPDRRDLDDAVLQMIGISDARARATIIDELYLETTTHFRQIRILEVQKQVQRTGGRRRLTAADLAASIWDSLSDDERSPTVEGWLAAQQGKRQKVSIPDGKATALGKGHMFAPAGVDFLQGKTVHHETYAHPEQAALAAVLANLEIRGEILLPTEERACKNWRIDLEKRLVAARSRFEALAGSRTGTDSIRSATAGMLMQWFIHGRK